MIHVEYLVTCDGDPENDGCEAEFSHIRTSALSSVVSLHNEIEKRGWTLVDGDLEGGKARTICPLHRLSDVDFGRQVP